MEKSKCTVCQRNVPIEKTGVKGQFRFASHVRIRPRTEEEWEENVHLRNVKDETCPGSGEIVK